MRRSKLDPAVTQKVVDLVRAGNAIEVAAAAAGVDSVALHAWLSAGSRQRRGQYRAFVDAVAKAKAESESRDVALIARAAGDDWRAAAWRLERLKGVRGGARARLAAEVGFDAALERLERGLDPETYRKVLALIAGVERDAVPDRRRPSGHHRR